MPKDDQSDQTASATLLPTLKLGRTVRFAGRAAWDSLGLVCALSLTLFAALASGMLFSIGIAGKLSAGGVGLLFTTAAFAVFLLSPLYAGCCLAAEKVVEHDEPGYG